MPNIDPAALSNTDPLATANPSTLSLKQTNGVSVPPSQKAAKPVNPAQRIDLEPLYTSLKASIGDHWALYKDLMYMFMIGKLFHAYRSNDLSSMVEHC